MDSANVNVNLSCVKGRCPYCKSVKYTIGGGKVISVKAIGKEREAPKNFHCKKCNRDFSVL